MRALVKRFGIAQLADVDCVFDPEDAASGRTGRVLLHGPTEILAELRLRDKLYEDGTGDEVGKDDRWFKHLDQLLRGANLDWKVFVKECLATPEAKPWLAPEVPTIVPDVEAAEAAGRRRRATG